MIMNMIMLWANHRHVGVSCLVMVTTDTTMYVLEISMKHLLAYVFLNAHQITSGCILLFTFSKLLKERYKNF